MKIRRRSSVGEKEEEEEEEEEEKEEEGGRRYKFTLFSKFRGLSTSLRPSYYLLTLGYETFKRSAREYVNAAGLSLPLSKERRCTALKRQTPHAS